jgi:pimeloyl-ACP methyl ester carboxylesterase
MRSQRVERGPGILLMVLLAGLAARAGGPATRRPPLDEEMPEPRLQLREVRHQASGTPVRTGSFHVWEDRAAQRGRVLSLDVLVLPALGEAPRPDPVFVFAGGPGQNVTGHLGGWVRHWMRDERDIVLVSQRGTGGDNRLDCELTGSDDNLQGYFDPIMDEASLRECLEALRDRFDLGHFGTPTAMDDIDDVRAALGYETINLYGGSYGSRAILEFMRRHPERVRTAILNSVAPVAFTNPLYHARSAQDALDLILDECGADASYRRAFGDVRAQLEVVFNRLLRERARATVRHPRTGDPVVVSLSRDAFAEALRVLMYSDSRQIPMLIHRAFEGDFDDFAQRGMETNRALRRSLAFGMLLCVTCGEDIPRIDPDSIAAETDGCFLGDGRVRRQMAVCSFWPSSQVPDDYGEPVAVDVPALLLSGTLDPVTPPRWGEQAARHLPRAVHVVVPGSHGVHGPCVSSLMRQVLELGGTADLDTGCVERMSLPAFALDPE